MYQNNYSGSVNLSPTRHLHFSESLLFVGTKESFYRRKKVYFPQDWFSCWFGTPTWPPFHCLGTPKIADVRSSENNLST